MRCVIVWTFRFDLDPCDEIPNVLGKARRPELLKVSEAMIVGRVQVDGSIGENRGQTGASGHPSTERESQESVEVSGRMMSAS